jgi:hypothetical protein
LRAAAIIGVVRREVEVGVRRLVALAHVQNLQHAEVVVGGRVPRGRDAVDPRAVHIGSLLEQLL